MPFVRRNPQGDIVAVLRDREADADEELSGDHPDLLSFIGRDPSESFATLDADFIRVLEDLIDALIDKGVLRVTDLPHGAQRKLSARKGFRRKVIGALDLLGDKDVI
ncbi:hypothetical protein GCM10025771_00560 [Niveibacterium umoris]|uniref:Tryptophan synthase subunit beta like protein n=1 Tax=Niveibacterium umoris TaxID=1193620 RepID=A0A840BQC4_9RHOO|nr:hypothetical protein [Niveibacterium umoris]MBB4014884.1 hypothetical protein [Niveibacterium umoris]